MRLPSLIPLSLLAGLTAGQLIGPVGPTTNLEDKTIECNILDYGGVADNQTDVAASIEATFGECVLNNPKSRLVIPEGNYLIKRSVVLSNGTNWAFQLDGLITTAYGGNWTVDRELILQGFAGEQIINSTINGEGDGKFLLDVLVIVNGMIYPPFLDKTLLRLIRFQFVQLSISNSILPTGLVHFKDKDISIETWKSEFFENCF